MLRQIFSIFSEYVINPSIIKKYTTLYLPDSMALQSNFQTYFSNFEKLTKVYEKFRKQCYSQIIQKRSL